MKAKRILCTLLVLFVCVAALTTKADAAYVSGDWEYTLSENNAVISAYRGSATRVTIPDEIDGLSVVGIGNKVFQNNYDLVSVTLPENLRSIGEYAFSGCTSLTSITLPEKLESVGYRAFYNTKSISKITVNSQKLKDCDSYEDTFYNVGSEVEDGVAVVFSDSVTYIPAYMFDAADDYYARIKSVKIGKNVTSIGKEAFTGCYDLETVTIPSSSDLRSIGQYAFSGCTSLTSITLPEKLESLGYRSFYNTKSISKITVNSQKLKDCDSYEDTFYNVGSEVEDGVAVVFSDSVTYIPAYMFDAADGYYARIKSVKIGKNVTSIGKEAFTGCYDLKTVTIPSGSDLRSIGDYAFCDCTSLTGITFPAKLETVGYRAFYNTQHLAKITINAKKLGNFDSSGNTFYNAGKEVEDGITVTFADAATRIPSYIFDGTYEYCPKIRTVSIGKGVTYIGYAAFRNCPTIQKFTFAADSKLSGIDGYAFEDCDGITTMVLPSTVAEIANYAFYHCSSLDTVRFSGNCPKMYNYTFKETVTNAYYPKGDKTWTSDKLVNYGGTLTWKSYTPVKISTQPKTAYAQNGETVEVTVGAKGSGLKYQWYIKNDGASKYTKSSVKKATYSCEMSETSKDRRVYCVVTDKYGNSVQSKTVMLRMEASIKTQPKNTYTKDGSTAKVTVTALGDGLTYQWYIKNAGASKYSKSSVTKATYSCKMSDSAKDRYAYCIVTDEYGNTVKTKTVVLRMAATITKQPKSVTVEEGDKAKVTVKAKGDGLTYTWYIKNEGSSKFSQSSVTSATYSVKMTEKVDGRQVYCVVTDTYGKEAKSSTVTLSMD